MPSTAGVGYREREHLRSPRSTDVERCSHHATHLEGKRHLTHFRELQRYVYRPTVNAEKARESVISHLIRTFFNGSAEQAMVTLIDRSGSDLNDAKLARLADLIQKTRRE